MSGAATEHHSDTPLDPRSYSAEADAAKRPDEQPAEAKDGDGDQKKTPMNPRLKAALIAAAVVVGLVAIIGAVLFWLDARKYENTDDAFIDTNIVHLAPRAAGQVTGVFVTDNQRVRAGQVLVQLDPSVARTQIAQAEASKAQALSQIAQAAAQVSVSEANVAQARADVIAPTAQAANAARDYRRYLAVQRQEPAAVAQQQVDAAAATAMANEGQKVSAVKKVEANEAQARSARTQIDAGRAQLRTAAAQEAQARLQIEYAQIVAPVLGHVAHKTVAVGDYAIQGQEVLSIVPDDLWVTANFKETQLQHIRPGDRVDLKIDAYPKVRFTGHIDSIQRGAGQSFAVLPAQNATGNYVKVVQRVPVKIVIDRPDPRYPLGPGMSVKPRVRIATDR